MVTESCMFCAAMDTVDVLLTVNFSECSSDTVDAGFTDCV